jgi:hypothetical protein
MASREGYDLFTKVGREAFFRYLKIGKFQGLMWEDTFMQLVCILIGHNIYNASDCHCGKDCKEEWACHRCHKYIEDRNYHILCRRIIGKEKWI